MTFDFDTPATGNRTGLLMDELMAPAVREAGLPLYWGAEFAFKTCPAFSAGVRQCAEGGRYGFTVQNEVYNGRVCWWMENVRGFSCGPEWIVPTHGTIFGLATAIRMFCLPGGKRLLVIHPGYNRYAQAAHRMGLESDASPMILRDGRYEIDWADLEKRMGDPRNGLLVFSNPNNPTGVIYTEEELARIGRLSEQYGIPVYSDEIFAEVTRNGRRVTPYILAAGPGQALAMSCTSLGKCMSLTGVNHANVLIPDEKLREAYIQQKYADHYGSLDPMLHAGLINACTEEGKAFVEALNAYIDGNVALFEREIPRLIPGARVIHPEGTFVVWADYRDCGFTAEKMEKRLAEEWLFCGDRGDDFGADPLFYRYAIAVPRADMERNFALIRSASAAVRKA